MKSNKKNLKKFSQRSNIGKRDKKQRQRAELLRLAEGLGVRTAGAKVRFTESSGRGYSSDTVRGVFRESAHGYGFVSSDEYDGGDIFIPKSGVGRAVDSDEVEVSFREYSGEGGERRTEGRITRILKEERKTIVGTAYERRVGSGRRASTAFFLLPDGMKTARELLIRNSEGVSDGDKLMVRLKRESVRSDFAVCELLDNFGRSDSKEANYLAILAESGIPTEFSEEELAEARRLASQPIDASGRVRPKGVIFTIDSETAKDLDDAISLSKTKDGYILGVHIADVSHYVREKTALDRLVMARGTSVYFTDKVVPMLPESLSNGACSLNPDEEKYALSATVRLSREGEILDTKIEETVIKSRIKGIYSEINEIFEGVASESLKKKYEDCLPSLRRMRELYLILKKRSAERGSLELESEEAYIPLDADGSPTDIVKRQRGDAERLIEQFMLTANEAVARLLTEKGIPCVYRVHSEPPREKREEFSEFAFNLGLSVKAIRGESVTAKDYGELLAEAKDRGVGFAVSYAMLRSMSKAEYSEVRRNHFGLSLDTYCHFTSPIRRLSDLATHRIIKAALLGTKEPARYRSYAKRAAAAASECEIRAEGAERRIESLYKVIYMKDFVGEIFDARISGATTHGVYCLLENTCEGLIPMSSLGAGAIFEEKNLSVRIGERVFRIGDTVRVRLEEADISSVRLRFSMERNDE